MQFTKRNVAKLYQQAINDNNGLMESVTKYVLDEWDDYDDPKNIVLDVIQHGCISGCVSGLVYYSDTVAYYEENKEAINDLLYEEMDRCGIYVFSEFFNYWEEDDPLALGEHNQNILAWFGFEWTMHNFAEEFEEIAMYL